MGGVDQVLFCLLTKRRCVRMSVCTLRLTSHCSQIATIHDTD